MPYENWKDVKLPSHVLSDDGRSSQERSVLMGDLGHISKVLDNSKDLPRFKNDTKEFINSLTDATMAAASKKDDSATLVSKTTDAKAYQDAVQKIGDLMEKVNVLSANYGLLQSQQEEQEETENKNNTLRMTITSSPAA